MADSREPSNRQSPTVIFVGTPLISTHEDFDGSALRNSTQKPLVRKITSVILGLFGMAFTLAAYNQASYYQTVCLPEEQRFQPDTTDLEFAFTCEEQSDGSYENCLALARSINQHESKDAGKPPDCPSKWLVEPPVIIVGIIWTLTFLMLVATLVLDEKITTHKFFRLTDFFAHLTIGIIYVGCALSMFIFFVWLVSSNIWCTDIKEEGSWNKWNRRGGNRHGRFVLEDDRTKGQPFALDRLISREDCADFNSDLYRPWLLLFGTIMTTVAGVMCIVTAVAMKKQEITVGIMKMIAGAENNSKSSRKSLQTQYTSQDQGIELDDAEEDDYDYDDNEDDA